MLTPQEHAEAILRRLPPRATVTLPLLDAANYTLATNLTAPFDSPRFDNSQMDGYALSSAQQQRTPGVFIVGPTVAAGADPDELYPEGLGDSVAPIMTGRNSHAVPRLSSPSKSANPTPLPTMRSTYRQYRSNSMSAKLDQIPPLVLFFFGQEPDLMHWRLLR